MKTTISFLLIILFYCQISAQINESPRTSYQWKNSKKTVLQQGFVVLKSGKKLDGQISLKGPYSRVEEVVFIGDGKEISFPVAALKAYGLNTKSIALTKGQTVQRGGIVNESDEKLYEWKNGGIAMDKVITNSVPREGYVITKQGDKVSGVLKIQKRDDRIWKFSVNTDSKKLKFKAQEVSRYGLTVSKDQIEQANLANQNTKAYPGKVFANKEISGRIAITKNGFKVTKIVLETSNGRRTQYLPSKAKGFEITKGKERIRYTATGGFFTREKFNGTVFQLYRNPKPTTYNKFATSLVKSTAGLGGTIAASEISKAHQKKNGYKANLDSIIRNSSKDQLITMRDNALRKAGYKDINEMNDKSKNDLFKNNVNTVQLAISGKEVSQSDGGIYNKEWIILNKKTAEKTVVYKSNFNKVIEPLLFGCYNYLSLSKSQQKKYLKWDNIESTVQFLDGCY